MVRQIVFIDGVGGKRYMRGKLKTFFSSHGYEVHFFDYLASSQTLIDIKRELTAFLLTISEQGEYFAIGYSFGGVLLRLVIQECKTSVIFPAGIVLLASPVVSVRLSRRFRNWRIYKTLTGECGQLTANAEEMSKIGLPSMPTACIYGEWPWLGVLGLVEGYQLQHDGMLAVDEVVVPDFKFTVGITSSHALIPGSALALIAMRAWFEKVS